MKPASEYRKFPGSRIATFDTFAAGLRKHHIAAMLEFDVTESRKKLRDLRKKGINVTFNAWIIKVVSSVLALHPEACAFLSGKRRLLIFNDINISVIVEKTVGNHKVPIPLVIEKTGEKSTLEITREIEDAKKEEMTGGGIVLGKRTSLSEKLYYHLPGFVRRFIWRMLLMNPRYLFKKMGNAIITSVGMMGRINGWFIHKSIHPVSFGIGSVIKKPVVSGNEIMIREILNMTILVDHDVIDGAPMVRMLDDLTRYIENGIEIPLENGVN
jgi:pyruvate/2-oxoglutarate dehydrogenase complex dihydrolipoamide acyltransferase (E2) component